MGTIIREATVFSELPFRRGNAQAHHRASPTTGGLLAPNGRTLAYAVTLPFRDPQIRSDALDTVATAGGRPARLVVARHGGIILAGWWPNGKGLLFWLDPFHSGSLAADGLGLYTLPLGGRPRLLTSALPRSLSFSPSGREVLLMGGSGRELWHAKTLTTCDVETALCHAVPRRPGTVALDPVWSPTGTTWAFVQAQDRGRRAGAFGFRTTQALLAWVHTHTLWIATAQGTHARELPAGTGVYGPQWSGDGRHLLFIRDNALWLIATRGGPPVKIVGPFPGTPDLFGFYGAPSWPITFAWNTQTPAPTAGPPRATANPLSTARRGAPPAPLRVLHQVTVAPRGLLPAISGHLVIWLQPSTAKPRGRWAAADLYGKDVASGRTFATTTAGSVVVGAEGSLAIPAISGSTVVWADCRACYSTGRLPPFGNVRIYAKDLATGHESLVAPGAGCEQWSPALSGYLVIWSQEGGRHPGLYATNLTTGRHVFVAPGVGAGAVSGQTVAWLARHNATWTINGKDLATGRSFSTPSMRPPIQHMSPATCSSPATWPCGRTGSRTTPWSSGARTWPQAASPGWRPSPRATITLSTARTWRSAAHWWPGTRLRTVSGTTIVWEDARTGAWSVRGTTLALR